MSDSPSLLVVEPKPDDRAALRELLEADGYAVTASASPEAALAEARRLRPAVIVGEHPLRLPNGPTLCAALRGDPATQDIPFVAVTAHAMPADLVDAHKSHRDVFLKPVSPEPLLERVATLTGRTRATR